MQQGKLGKGVVAGFFAGTHPMSQMARQVPPTGLESQGSEPGTGGPLQSCADLSQTSGSGGFVPGPHSPFIPHV
jgi:hypothetical protein